MIASISRLNGFVVAVASRFDGVAALLMRLILAPMLFASGWEKLHGENWFSGALDSFPFPFSVLPADFSWFLATWTELLGSVLLLLGLAVRWITPPLLVVMFVAAWSVHWDNGWAAVAPSFPDEICIADSAASRDAGILDRIARCQNVNERTIEAAKRLARGKEIMREHGRWDYLNGFGSIVKLNNGIEFAALYFSMILALFVTGGGRWFSLDYWLARLGSRRTEPGR